MIISAGAHREVCDTPSMYETGSNQSGDYVAPLAPLPKGEGKGSEPFKLPKDPLVVNLALDAQIARCAEIDVGLGFRELIARPPEVQLQSLLTVEPSLARRVARLVSPCVAAVGEPIGVR